MEKQPRAWKQQKATTNPGLEGQKEEVVLLKSGAQKRLEPHDCKNQGGDVVSDEDIT